MTSQHPLIVAITGRAGAGKDTAGSFFRTALHAAGFAVHRMAFADTMRDMLAPLVPQEYMRTPALKEKPIPHIGKSYRELMQTLGTEWGRDMIAADLWVSALARRVAARTATHWLHHVDTGVAFVITDLRLPNEYEWVRSMGGVVVRVHRDDLPATRAHSSEQHFDEFSPDLTFHNAATPEALEFLVRGAVPEMLVAWRRSISTRDTSGAAA